MISKIARRLIGVALLSAVFSPSAARAHSEQVEASRVQIYPRRDYLTIRVSGAAADWRDVAAGDSHHDAAPKAAKAPLDWRQAASDYALSNLFLEQGGQILALRPVKSASPRPDSSERFELFLRAERPFRLASQPLSVASSLFDGLKNATTWVELGGQQKRIRGAQIVEFPAAQSVPTTRGDALDFAASGLLHPLSAPDHALFLAALFLAASLVPPRRLVAALLAFTFAHGIGFSLAATEVFSPSPALTAAANALSVAALGAALWLLARRAAPVRTEGAVLVALSVLGGLAQGFSGAPPLRVWGMPENGLFGCLIAFTLGVALTQLVLAALLGPLLAYWKRKFTHGAQYGGMSWPRAVQIASMGCVAAGGFWLLQIVA